MTDAALAQEKTTLRKQMRSVLKHYSATEGAASDAQSLAKRVLAFCRTKRAVPGSQQTHGAPSNVRIGAFISMPHEINTMPLLEALLAAGFELALPACLDHSRMEFRCCDAAALHKLKHGEIIAQDAQGLRCTQGATVELAELQLLLIPGIAFDSRGARLGQGAGYYDRALAAENAQSRERAAAGKVWRVGLGFEQQLVNRVPKADHDQTLDALLTPHRTLLFNR